MPVEAPLVFPVATLARSRRRYGFVQVNPRYRDRLAAWGLQHPEDFLDHPGEIVSGHPDRHVMRVTLGGGADQLNAYLKREHRIPWKDRCANLRDGFGFTSVSQREAVMLQLLARRGIPVPQWLACGEDGRGRAFLLLKAVDGAVDLRRFLVREARLPTRLRRGFARRLGRLLARLHHTGIEYPDLYAKHVLVEPATGDITFLDWQRSRKPRPLSWRIRCRDLAALNASVADELASPSDRFAALLAYLRASGISVPRISMICRRLEDRTAKLLQRSSIREQRLPAFHDSQPLIWLAGEALCVTPQCRLLFDKHELQQLAYGSGEGKGNWCESIDVVLPGRGRGRLTRRQTQRTLAWCADWLRGRRWTSPEVRAAAELLRRERLGEPPCLLAFGQRIGERGVVESFLLTRELPRWTKA